MNNKMLWLALLVALVVVLGFAFWGNWLVTPEPTPTATSTVTTVATTTEKVFTVTAGNFAFSPATLSVNRGDVVRIIFVNNEGFHDWVLDEFAARTPQLDAGQRAEVSFVADRTGSFEYYCSVGTHRSMGMVGKLVVN